MVMDINIILWYYYIKKLIVLIILIILKILYILHANTLPKSSYENIGYRAFGEHLYYLNDILNDF